MPRTKTDLDKMGPALHGWSKRTTTLTHQPRPQTGETILSGLGEPHVQIALERMTRSFGVNVELGLPRVAYRETISAKTVGRVQAQEADRRRRPVRSRVPRVSSRCRRGDFEFGETGLRRLGARATTIPAVEKGVREAMERGPLAGYPVVNVRVTLTDGSYHNVDSNEMSFKMAASEAFKKAAGRPSRCCWSRS